MISWPKSRRRRLAQQREYLRRLRHQAGALRDERRWAELSINGRCLVILSALTCIEDALHIGVTPDTLAGVLPVEELAALVRETTAMELGGA